MIFIENQISPCYSGKCYLSFGLPGLAEVPYQEFQNVVGCQNDQINYNDFVFTSMEPYCVIMERRSNLRVSAHIRNLPAILGEMRKADLQRKLLSRSNQETPDVPLSPAGHPIITKLTVRKQLEFPHIRAALRFPNSQAFNLSFFFLLSCFRVNKNLIYQFKQQRTKFGLSVESVAVR